MATEFSRLTVSPHRCYQVIHCIMFQVKIKVASKENFSIHFGPIHIGYLYC